MLGERVLDGARERVDARSVREHVRELLEPGVHDPFARAQAVPRRLDAHPRLGVTNVHDRPHVLGVVGHDVRLRLRDRLLTHEHHQGHDVHPLRKGRPHLGLDRRLAVRDGEQLLQRRHDPRPEGEEPRELNDLVSRRREGRRENVDRRRNLNRLFVRH